MKKFLVWTAGIAFSVLLLSSCVTPGAGGAAGGQQPPEEYTYPPYNGIKKRIAVLPFDNKVANRWWESSWNIEEGLTEMVITEIMKTNRFIVVERTSLNEVLREQDLGASGRVKQDSAARVGELLGAQLLIKGAVTEFTEKESGGVGGIMIGGVGLGAKTNTGHVAMDLRMIDSTSGQILQSHRAESKITSTGVGGIALFSGVAFGGAGYKKTALGKATRAAVHEAVTFIVQQMESQPWQGMVVKADGKKIYVNGGADLNLQAGTVFAVYSKGEELIDPASGLSLGYELTRSGSCRVIQVMEKAAVAEAIEGAGFKRGDILKMQ